MAWGTDLVRQGENVDPSGAGSNNNKQLRLCQDNEAPDPGASRLMDDLVATPRVG
jgi:hypothetical protein